MPIPGRILRLLTVAFIAVAAMSSAVLPSVHAQSPPDELLFVRASVDNDRPYLGQQMTYVARIYQNSGVTLPFGEVRYESPDFAGFWNSQLVEQDRYTETIDSEEYSVLELRTALFPTVVGTVVIDPAALTVSTGTAGSRRLLESPPVPVEVRPLPVGAPSGFTGAVGRFNITAEVDSDTGQVNEPVQLTVTVSGEGNIEALPDPAWPEFTGWRVIESPADTASQLIAGQVAGSRTYEIVLVPERAGELTIPGIGYTHFDPGQEKYVEAATAAIVISVVSADGTAAIPPVPGAETVGEEESPLMRPVKAVPPSLRQGGTELTGSAAYWAAWGIPGLIIAGALVWRRRREALEAARAESLRRNALPNARTALARAVAAGVDPRVASADGVLSYLSARLEAAVGGMTREALLRRLREAGVQPELMDRANEILAAGEAARYAPTAGGPAGAAGDAEQASQFLGELDGAIEA